MGGVAFLAGMLWWLGGYRDRMLLRFVMPLLLMALVVIVFTGLVVARLQAKYAKAKVPVRSLGKPKGHMLINVFQNTVMVICLTLSTVGIPCGSE